MNNPLNKTDNDAHITLKKRTSSLFEQACQKRPLQICPQFIYKNKIKPVYFKANDQVLNPSDDIQNKFTQTILKHKNQLLSCSSKPLSTKNVTCAVLFSGGPASGGHNVIAGIHKVFGKENTLYGILNGPKGLIEGTLIKISEEKIASVLNCGGFDLLGSDRTKIKTSQQIEAVKHTVKQFNLDGIIIIGGDDQTQMLLC